MKNVALVFFILLFMGCSKNEKYNFYRPFDGLKGDVSSYTVGYNKAAYKNGRLEVDTSFVETKNCEFNSTGQIIKMAFFYRDVDGLLPQVYDAKFDSDGFRTEWKGKMFLDGQLIEYLVTLAERNSDNVVFKRIYLSKGEPVIDTITESWNGNIHTSAIKKADSSGYVISTTYDQNMNIIHVKYIENGQMTSEYTTKYDANNIAVQDSIVSSGGNAYTIVNYESKVDDKGNWIERIGFDGDSSNVLITKRNIIYR